MNMDIEARERKSAIKKKAGFDRWLDDPMVRMGMSMIPSGERADGLRMLLQSAFEAGYGVGCGDILGDMLEGMLKRKDGESPR